MLNITYKNIFYKDIKLAEKRGLNLNILKEVIQDLAEEKLIAKKFRDHVLIGNYKGCRECHLQPDWLLIYKKEPNEIIFLRTGTHSDLFKK